MPFAKLGEISLFYSDQGKGDLLVLVHGSLGDYRDWRNQVAPLSKAYFKVVSYSRRNHYPNPWKNYPANYSLATERDDLISLIKELNQPANLIGHSYGGYAAALVARDYPGQVKKLVLAEPPIFTMLNGGENRSLALRFQNEVIQPARTSLRNKNLDSGIRLFLDGISGMRNVYDRLKPSFRKVMLENARTALPEIGITPERDPFDCSDAARISAPTLLIKGEGSPRVLQSIIVELSKCIPNSRVETIPRASHGMIWDNSKYFNEKVLEFLKKKEDK